MPNGIADRWPDVRTITRRDVSAVVEESRAQGIPGRGRRPGVSDARGRQVYSTLQPLFKWLLALDLIDADPCAGAARPAVATVRERVLTDDEVRKFWSAAGGLGYPFEPLLKLLLITGQRRDEVAGMMWSEIDGDVWTIPAERTKNGRTHTLLLPPMARELLPKDALGARVFSTTGTSSVSGFSRVKRRIDSQMRIAPWRIHDLRRTAAVGFQRAGVPLHIIERTLNHISGSYSGVVGVYQRFSFEEEVRMALENWSALLTRIIKPQQRVI